MVTFKQRCDESSGLCPPCLGGFEGARRWTGTGLPASLHLTMLSIARQTSWRITILAVGRRRFSQNNDVCCWTVQSNLVWQYVLSWVHPMRLACGGYWSYRARAIRREARELESHCLENETRPRGGAWVGNWGIDICLHSSPDSQATLWTLGGWAEAGVWGRQIGLSGPVWFGTEGPGLEALRCPFLGRGTVLPKATPNSSWLHEDFWHLLKRQNKAHCLSLLLYPVIHITVCSVPQHSPGVPLFSVTYHQPHLHISASIQMLMSCQSCLNPLRSLPAFLKHDKPASGKTTSSFPCCFPAENPRSGKKVNLCGKDLSSSLVIFCRTGKTSPSAEEVKAIEHSGCRNDLLSGEVQTPVEGRCSSCIGLGEKHTLL